jgi:dihydrofolate reductase
MKAIFAVDALGGFGADGDMPWPRCKEDLQRFKAYTTGTTVVMGRGTWDSNMPKPLPNRRNIVLSSTINSDPRCEVFRSITELNMNLKADEKVFVIGGVETLWKLRSFINTVYLTRFDLITKSTVVMKTESFLEGFNMVSSSEFSNHIFQIWERSAIIQV